MLLNRNWAFKQAKSSCLHTPSPRYRNTFPSCLADTQVFPAEESTGQENIAGELPNWQIDDLHQWNQRERLSKLCN